MRTPDDMRNPKTGNVQCRATSKATGQRCQCWSIKGGVVCHKHGGAAPQVRRSANARIREAADDAAAYLVHWMSDDTVDVRVRTQIAQDLLNRAGISSKQIVGVEIRKFEQLVDAGTLLIDLPNPDIIDADVAKALPSDNEGDSDWTIRVEQPVKTKRRRRTE